MAVIGPSKALDLGGVVKKSSEEREERHKAVAEWISMTIQSMAHIFLRLIFFEDQTRHRKTKYTDRKSVV